MKEKVGTLIVMAAMAVAGSTYAQPTAEARKATSADVKDSAGAAHKATATVEKVDPAAGVVTLSHGPVKSLNWPAMTMGFKVRDKALLDKLAQGKRVEVEFVQSGKDYVIIKAG
jgi:Cu(I)/Ag(I) efflux system protein CusF